MNKRIKFVIEFDESNIPQQIIWEANEDMKDEVVLKSLFISGWEEKTKSSATFSIWTKEMRIDEMQQVFVQSLLTLASNFEKATKDANVVKKMKEFVSSLGKN